MKEFIYFPSFSTGAAGAAARKGIELENGMPWRFWYDKYPKGYRCNNFLISAGHYYKKIDHIEKYDFHDDCLIMGDSGGYQIATGTIEWDPSLRKTIFEWLENNSHIAMNLDIPTRKKYAGKFDECIRISMENFKYFADNQTGKTDFLNVLQGSTINKYSEWYNRVKDFPFQGWSVGGAQGSVTAFMSAIVVLSENGELHKENIKWLHILGTSSIIEFLILAKLQAALEKVDSRVHLTTDSSTPSKSSVYGYYYDGYDLKNLKFHYIHLPRQDKFEDFERVKNMTMPILNEVDRNIWSCYDLESFLKWDSASYAWLVLHNFALFQDCLRVINNIVNNDDYLLKQTVSRDTYLVLSSIDEILNSKKPREVFRKYLPIYEKVSRLGFDDTEMAENTFF